MASFSDRLRQMAQDPRNRARLQNAVSKLEQQARKPENRRRLQQLTDRLGRRRPSQ